MVLVSHAKKFVFLKTRKTAGTTIEMALERFCRPANSVVKERTQAKVSSQGIVGRRLCKQGKLRRMLGFTDWYSHMPAASVRRHLGDEKWHSYRKITSVRNPFDAAVSLYYWRLSELGKKAPEDFSELRSDFKAMLGSVNWSLDYQVTHIGDDFVAEETIRFENLKNDIEALITRIDPGHDAAGLPETKKTRHRRTMTTANYFDDVSIETVRKGAAWVFDNFDYPATPGEPVDSSENTLEVSQ